MKNQNDIQSKLFLFIFSVIAFFSSIPMKSIDEVHEFEASQHEATKNLLKAEPGGLNHVHFNINAA